MPDEGHVLELDALRDAVAEAAAAYAVRIPVYETGTVTRARDGVIRVEGLPNAGAEGVLELEGGVAALTLGLDEHGLDAIVLDASDEVAVGAHVSARPGRASIGVGDRMLGRVVDPLGRPLDGLALTGRRTPMPLEREAPGIADRAAVHQPLYTGALAVDAMFPIGKGQRELLIGNEATGKTSLAVDCLLRQRDTDVISIYVAIGRRRVETWEIVDDLKDKGGRFVVVSTPEDDSPGLRYLAPYAGCAIAEYFMERGEHAVVVYDDLTAHAVAWRELSLLLERPPGREAFPGDIFYLHARLLERATQLSKDRGGGSLTALPIARLESGRLSSYIPTNLISITDGQLVFSEPLFAAGQKPAIDAALSVSRIGGRAQSQAMRVLTGKLRLEYSSFLELESFARLSTRLETSTQRRLDWGRRVRLLLKGPRRAPLDLFSEVARLALAADDHALLALAEEGLETAVDEAVTSVRAALPGLAARIERTGTLSDADRDAVASALFERLGVKGGG